METISIRVMKEDVYEEVAKATDYTGAKLMDGDEKARDRILATDDELSDLGRFWEESVLAANERLKEMLVSGGTKEVMVSGGTKETGADGTETGAVGEPKAAYVAVLEVSKSFDKELAANVESALRNFFIASIIGQWFKLANKGEASDYFEQASGMMDGAERLLYSRRRPRRPSV